MKMAKCIQELERIYKIQHGGDRKSNGNNFALISQEQLAEQIGIDRTQLLNYKKLNELKQEISKRIDNLIITNIVIFHLKMSNPMTKVPFGSIIERKL